jgi:hypothetical protein
MDARSPRSGDAARTLRAVRRVLLLILVLGIAGTAAELLLLGHFEKFDQWIPLALLAAGIGVLAWDALNPGRGSARALQATMVLFILSGALGMVLHYRANVEFQRELRPSIQPRELFWKVLRAKAPPALAPGTMVQLGLIGLAYVYGRPSAAQDSGEE